MLELLDILNGQPTSIVEETELIFEILHQISSVPVDTLCQLTKTILPFAHIYLLCTLY
jgi:hypothetical protein